MKNLSLKKILMSVFILNLSFTLSSCAKELKLQASDLSSSDSRNTDLGSPGDDSKDSEKAGGHEALAWEKNNTGRKVWSDYVHAIVENETFTLIDGADDMAKFCPKYANASKQQKINFWGQLVAAISKHESGWDPTMRFHETTMGTDPVTKKPVYSEGLMQLSYQDIQWEPRCEFDWEKDKNLAVKDPKKTILNPYKNLRCSLIILERQLKKYHKIAIDSGVYWAVIKPNGKYQKIADISATTKSLKFCK